MRIKVDGSRLSYTTLLRKFGAALVPLVLTLVTLWGAWWYVVIHQQPDTQAAVTVERMQTARTPGEAEPAEEKLQELGGSFRNPEPRQEQASPRRCNKWAMPNCDSRSGRAGRAVAAEFYTYFAITAAIFAAILLYYYWTLEAEQFEVLSLLMSSVMPLGILTVVVLAVMCWESPPQRNLRRSEPRAPSCSHSRRGRSMETHQGGRIPHRQDHIDGVLAVRRLGIVLGGVCYPGGQALLESWVLSLNLSPVQFMILSQAIIFILGWPLEWTEIIVIFVPSFCRCSSTSASIRCCGVSSSLSICRRHSCRRRWRCPRSI